MKGIIFRILILAALSACGPAANKKTSDVSASFGESRLEIPWERGVFLGIRDCDVYRSVTENGAVTGWEKTLSKPFYPLGFCSKSEIRIEGDYVNVFLCVSGLGAGGGCSAEGNYRSRDGRVWERE